jgi:hypothetical protein
MSDTGAKVTGGAVAGVPGAAVAGGVEFGGVVPTDPGAAVAGVWVSMPGPTVTGGNVAFGGFVGLGVKRRAAWRAGDSLEAAGFADTTCFATGRFSTR